VEACLPELNQKWTELPIWNVPQGDREWAHPLPPTLITFNNVVL
jgi:hypothetical protein